MSEAVTQRRQVRLRVGMWWRLLLMAGMMASVGQAVLDVVHAGGYPWRGGYLVVALVIVPLETYISQRMIRRRELRGDELMRFRIAEGLTVLLALEALRFLWQGLPALGGRVERLLDFEFFLGSLIVIAHWQIASAMIRWFQELDYQPVEKAPSVTSPEYDLWISSRARHVQHTAAFQRILAMFLFGGIAILILGGLARVDPMAIIDFRRGTIRALILHVLVYFVLGMALVAEARLSLLHTRWQQDEVVVSRVVARRWPVFVAGLLLLVALVSLLLPVGYSVGLLEALSYGLNLLITVFLVIAYGLLYVVGLLLYPIRWLLSLGRGEEPPPPPEMPPMVAPTPAPTAAGTPAILDVLKTLLFWLVALGIVAYALYNFGREHGVGLRQTPWLRPLWLLISALSNLWRLIRLGARRAGETVGRAVRRARPAGLAPAVPRLRRPGRMSPRELVQYYYLSTLRRAEAAGQPRRASQTADEFSARLAGALPEVDEDVHALTAAFDEAKYSAHEVAAEQAHDLRPFWERVRQALREQLRQRRRGG